MNVINHLKDDFQIVSNSMFKGFEDFKIEVNKGRVNEVITKKIQLGGSMQSMKELINEQGD
jgi:hypothetical protein